VGGTEDMKQVSAVIIVKNEERCLRRCLESLDPRWEKIVVDTGSTDRSQEIALDCGADLFTFQWIDDFSAARNFGLEQAHRGWILTIDADEWLEPRSVDAINYLVRLPLMCGFEGQQVNFLPDGKEHPLSVWRLFRNHPSIRYENTIHEQIIYSLNRFATERGFKLSQEPALRLLHDGYDMSRIEAKMDRNGPMLKAAIEKDPKNPYLLLKYSQNLRVQGQPEEEFEILRRFMSCVVVTAQSTPEELQGIERFKMLRTAREGVAVAAIPTT